MKKIHSTLFIALLLTSPFCLLSLPNHDSTALSFKGHVIENKFLNKTDWILKATWNKTPSAAFYKIYKKGKLIKKIGANEPLVFITYLSDKNRARDYTLAAVSAHHTESARVPLTIP